LDLPPAMVDAMVMLAAEQDPVGKIGGAALGLPPLDVMRLRVGRRQGAVTRTAPVELVKLFV